MFTTSQGLKFTIPRTRLILWSIALVVVAGFAILGFLITQRVQSSVQQGSRIVLGDFALLLRTQVERDLNQGRDPREQLSQFWQPIQEDFALENKNPTSQSQSNRSDSWSSPALSPSPPSLYAVWFDLQGEPLWTNFPLLQEPASDLAPPTQPVRGLGEVLAGTKSKSSGLWKPSPEHEEVLVTTVAIREQGQVVGAVTILQETQRMESFIQVFRSRLLLAVALIGSGMTLFIYLVARWLLEPMRRLTEWARQVSEGQRVPLPRLGSGRRARQLGRELEAMRLALEGRKELAAYARQVTHELKSPLTGIRAAAELLTLESLPAERRTSLTAALDHEVERSERVLERLHQLAQLEELEALGNAQEVDLVSLINNCVQRRKPLAELRGVKLRWQPPTEQTIVSGEMLLLEGAIDNLLENALDFSSQDSEVSVELQIDAAGFLLQISDQGPGLPDYALEQVFERFYSLRGEEQGGKSSGLGLTLVRQTAELHSGWASLENQAQTGAIAKLWLPEAKPK